MNHQPENDANHNKLSAMAKGQVSSEESKQEHGNISSAPLVRQGSGDEARADVLMRHMESQEYHCVICCEVILETDTIMNCSRCFALFHLDCSNKWSEKCEQNRNRQWICPCCNYDRDGLKLKQRVCFCRKTTLLQNTKNGRKPVTWEALKCRRNCCKVGFLICFIFHF